MRIRYLTIALAVASMMLWPTQGWTQEEQGTEVEVEVGAWDTSVDGSPVLAAQYEPIDGGPVLGLEIDSLNENSSVLLDSEFLDTDFQSHLLDFEFSRIVRSTTTYESLLHRLGHDSLENLTAATNHGRVVRHTDTDPTADYQIDYQVLESIVDIQLPSASAWTFHAGYRRQEREGVRQQTTVSHCDTCHVTSQGRAIDESTQDLLFGVETAWLGGSVRAEYNHREHREGMTSIDLLFDDALHPELRVPIFDNRLQYDSAEGPQPVDVRPDTEKDTLKLGVNWADLGGVALNARGIWSTTDNQLTGLSSDYTGYVVNATHRFEKPWTIRWRGLGYTLENDDVFVEVNDRVGIAGPQGGGTYYDYYPDAPGDFLRESALNREVFDSKFDVGYRFGKKPGTLRVLWNWESVDRDHYQVKPGETETTTNVLGLTWSARPVTKARVQASYRHGSVDNPFTLVDGGNSTLVSPKVPNPFHPDGAQYYESHAARIAETTAYPESWDQMTARVAVPIGPTMLTGSYRYWDGENQDGDLTDWGRTNQSAILALSGTPTPKVQWHLAYTWLDGELDFAASIPIFDG